MGRASVRQDLIGRTGRKIVSNEERQDRGQRSGDRRRDRLLHHPACIDAPDDNGCQCASKRATDYFACRLRGLHSSHFLSFPVMGALVGQPPGVKPKVSLPCDWTVIFGGEGFGRIC